jgi:hypothetical protein
MPALKDIAPALVIQLVEALAQEGRAGLAAQVEQACVLRCTFSDDPDVGYIYIVRGPVSPQYAKLAAPVADTVSFFQEHGLNVDVDHEGQLFGIEYVDREDLSKALKAARAL